MAGADDAADAVKVVFGHGGPGGKAQSSIKQVLGDFAADWARLVTLFF